MFGTFTQTAVGKPVSIGLVAVDKGGQAAILETYTFAVEKVPEFTLRRGVTRTQDSAEYTDVSKPSTPFFVGTPYQVAPLSIDVAATNFSTGDVSDVHYRLDQPAKTDFFVNGRTGVIFGRFNQSGVVKMSLFVVDKGGKEALLEEYAFTVMAVLSHR